MDTRDWITVIALVFGPLLAVLASLYIGERLRIRNERVGILRTLITTRHLPLADDRLRTLSLIDVVFNKDKDKDVRRLWHEWFAVVSMKDYATSEDIRKDAARKSVELINEMARVLGLGTSLTQADLERVYTPKGLSDQWALGQELASELLRVLRNTESLVVKPKPQGSLTAAIASIFGARKGEH
jgi:hypothetical protein